LDHKHNTDSNPWQVKFNYESIPSLCSRIAATDDTEIVLASVCTFVMAIMP
jgi:hypothetical protein